MADKKGIILDDSKVETDVFTSTIRKEPLDILEIKDVDTPKEKDKQHNQHKAQ